MDVGGVVADGAGAVGAGVVGEFGGEEDGGAAVGSLEPSVENVSGSIAGWLAKWKGALLGVEQWYGGLVCSQIRTSQLDPHYHRTYPRCPRTSRQIRRHGREI